MRAPILGGALAAVRRFRIVWLALSFQCLDEACTPQNDILVTNEWWKPDSQILVLVLGIQQNAFTNRPVRRAGNARDRHCSDGRRCLAALRIVASALLWTYRFGPQTGVAASAGWCRSAYGHH